MWCCVQRAARYARQVLARVSSPFWTVKSTLYLVLLCFIDRKSLPEIDFYSLSRWSMIGFDLFDSGASRPYVHDVHSECFVEHN